MKGILLLLAAATGSLLATLPAAAQYDPVATILSKRHKSVYATDKVELQPGGEISVDTTSNVPLTYVELKTRPLEAVGGRWSAPQPWTRFQRTASSPIGLVGIHTHVLPNGRVLTWEGHNDTDPMMSGASPAYTWYPYLNTYQGYHNEFSNIFCSGHTLLANGQLMVAGGHYSYGKVNRPFLPNSTTIDTGAPVNNPGSPDYIPNGVDDVNNFIGLRDVNIFSYLGSRSATSSDYAWQAGAKMKYRRWYPTATTLADGRVLLTAGQRFGNPVNTPGTVQADNPELFTVTASTATATTGTWQEMGSAARRLPWYPWMFQAPDGRVFNAGPNYHTGWLNPTGATIGKTNPQQWSDGPTPLLGWGTVTPSSLNRYEETTRMWGSAVLYQPNKVLVLGGFRDGYDRINLIDRPVTNTTEILDLTSVRQVWDQGPAMRYPRFHANATLLADGSVLVTGGATTITSTSDNVAVLPTELWVPGSSSWQLMAPLDVPRLYHSTAVLLPDATVLTAGGGQGGGYQDHPDYQIFSPPYLFKNNGSRPRISYAPPYAAYGQPLKVQTPDAGSIRRATWVRLSSVTHSFNMNQRFLELAFTYPRGTDPEAPTGELVLTAPTNPNECPPGHYLLFLLDDQGVPSVASIVAVGAAACPASLGLTYTDTRPDACHATLRFTVANPTNCQTDYAWTVNGAPAPAGNNLPYLDCPVSNDAPTVTVQVTASRTCSGQLGLAGQPVAAGREVTTFFRACNSEPNYRPAGKP